jgi:hypothetical protein
MPFKDKSKTGVWHGQVKWEGRTYRARFATRREAVAWESEKRKEMEAAEKQEETTRTVTDLVGFCNEYLDYARLRFVPKTYDNKRRICKRLLSFLGNVPIAEVTFSAHGN